MPSIAELKARARDITTKAEAAITACETGVITTKQLSATMAELKTADAELAKQFKAHQGP